MSRNGGRRKLKPSSTQTWDREEGCTAVKKIMYKIFDAIIGWKLERLFIAQREAIGIYDA